MSANGDIARVLINTFVRGYAVEAFKDLRMNNILLLMLDMIEGTQGGSVTPVITEAVTSAAFANATDCPLPDFEGREIIVFWNEASRYIKKDAGEWDDLPGGGFKVLVDGFDSTADLYHFVITGL